MNAMKCKDTNKQLQLLVNEVQFKKYPLMNKIFDVFGIFLNHFGCQ